MTDRRGIPIKDIIPDVFRLMGLEGRLAEGRLVREWPDIVGEEMGKNSSLIDIKDGVLFVEAENNIWMQEIRFLQKDIIARIKTRFPDIKINGIRLFIGRERGKG